MYGKKARKIERLESEIRRLAMSNAILTQQLRIVGRYVDRARKEGESATFRRQQIELAYEHVDDFLAKERV